jgi:hypothetical protein
LQGKRLRCTALGEHRSHRFAAAPDGNDPSIVRLAGALLIAAALVTVPVLALDQVLALVGAGMAARDALVALAAVAGALGAALWCPRSRGARLVLVAAALGIAVEPVGDGLVLPLAASALALVVVWLARPTAVPAASG